MAVSSTTRIRRWSSACSGWWSSAVGGCRSKTAVNKRWTLAHLTLHADPSPHEGHEFFDDGESEACSAEAAGRRPVGFVRRLRRCAAGPSTGMPTPESLDREPQGDAAVRLRHRVDAGC